MFAMLATLVFTTAGCASVAVIATSVRDALPSLRRLSAERRSLAADRVYLFTMIETPRHSGMQVPIAEPVRARITPQLGTKLRARRQGRMTIPAATPAKYPAAA